MVGGGSNNGNPMMDSMMQGMFNRQAARDQQRMNMVSQSTPYGSLDYSMDPNSPSGYRATQSFSPEIQKLLNSNISTSQGASDAANALLGNVSGAMAKPLDLSWGATEANIDALNKNTLDPQWTQAQNDFEQQMANQGLNPGSVAYQNANRNFMDAKNRAYNNMYLQGHQIATNDITNQYNSPFNALASLRGASQIAQPVQSMGLTSTPQESIQPVDYMGAQNSYRQNQMADRQATMGGMFGLGGTLLGGLGGSLLGGLTGFGLGVPLSTSPQSLRAYNGQAEWSPW